MAVGGWNDVYCPQQCFSTETCKCRPGVANLVNYLFTCFDISTESRPASPQTRQQADRRILHTFPENAWTAEPWWCSLSHSAYGCFLTLSCSVVTHMFVFLLSCSQQITFCLLIHNLFCSSHLINPLTQARYYSVQHKCQAFMDTVWFPRSPEHRPLQQHTPYSYHQGSILCFAAMIWCSV